MSDLIRREDAIKAVAIAALDDRDELEAIKAIPSVQVSGDLISRQDAIEAVRKEYEDAINIGDNGDAIAYDIERILSALPSAEAVQGEWIRVGHDIYECSLCHQNVMTRDIDCYAYCHGCGAKMTKGGDPE